MLAKWNPFASGGIARSTAQLPAFDDLFREADRLFESTLSHPGWSTAVPAADIYETQDTVIVKMDLPGHDPNAIGVEVEGDLLTVRAGRDEQAEPKATWLRRERSVGQMARSFVLPSSVDAARCEAKLEQGVLTLTLQKREEARPRSITVKVNG